MIAGTIVTAQMYEEKSFLRDNDLLSFVIHILDTLNDFDIVLEASLVRGLNIWLGYNPILGFNVIMI